MLEKKTYDKKHSNFFQWVWPNKSIERLILVIINEISYGRFHAHLTHAILYKKRKKKNWECRCQSYQLPKFQYFYGKGNPKQLATLFMEICNNVGIKEDVEVKQFVCSLKEYAYTCYTNIEANCINNWEQMKMEFLTHFYSTCHIFSKFELTNTKQKN